MKTVKLIIADINHYNNEEELLAQIAPCYVEKYRKHKFPKEAKQELVSGEILNQYLGINKSEQISYNEHGKPYLVVDNQFFNISHSGDYVVVAIEDCNVGVDVERIRKCHDATVRKVFNKEQKEALENLDGIEKDKVFSKIWTECEAVLKLKGTGFGEGWDTILKGNYYTHTIQLEEVFVTCATEEEVTIEVENL